MVEKSYSKNLLVEQKRFRLLTSFGLLVIAGSTLLLISCSPLMLNKEECSGANWFEMGEADGARGEEVSVFNKYRKSCAKFDIVADEAAYTQGREVGLQRYCTDIVGFFQGAEGFTYKSVCPAELEEGFMRGFSVGEKLYDATRRVQSIEDEINSSLDGITKNVEEMQSLQMDITVLLSEGQGGGAGSGSTAEELTNERSRKRSFAEERFEQLREENIRYRSRIDELKRNRAVEYREYLMVVQEAGELGYLSALMQMLQ